jgi:hypothetical protein
LIAAFFAIAPDHSLSRIASTPAPPFSPASPVLGTTVWVHCPVPKAPRPYRVRKSLRSLSVIAEMPTIAIVTPSPVEVVGTS